MNNRYNKPEKLKENRERAFRITTLREIHKLELEELDRRAVTRNKFMTAGMSIF